MGPIAIVGRREGGSEGECDVRPVLGPIAIVGGGGGGGGGLRENVM